VAMESLPKSAPVVWIVTFTKAVKPNYVVRIPSVLSFFLQSWSTEVNQVAISIQASGLRPVMHITRQYK